jgi:hypothetical protein
VSCSWRLAFSLGRRLSFPGHLSTWLGSAESQSGVAACGNAARSAAALQKKALLAQFV